jgi:peptide deformylase
MIREILIYGNSVLRKRADAITTIDDKILALVKDLIETVELNENRIGLAATQIGVLKRVFVIRPVVKTEKEEYGLGETEVYINPVLTDPSNETTTMEEGCLSFPGISAQVERPNEIDVTALDANGNTFTKRIKGFKARQIMHENDHLNGVLFPDRADKKERQNINHMLHKLKKQS